MPRLRVNYKFSILHTKHPFFAPPVDSRTSAVITTDSTAAQLTPLDPIEMEREKGKEKEMEGEKESQEVALHEDAEGSDEARNTQTSSDFSNLDSSAHAKWLVNLYVLN